MVLSLAPHFAPSQRAIPGRAPPQVVRCVAESHGAVLTAEAAELALGMRPLDAWAAVAEALGIERSAQELFDQSEPLLRDRWAAWLARLALRAETGRLPRPRHSAGCDGD